ncbi:MAG: serine hydrolase [Thiogranum sp.]|nr:serine hydrolase [Thiogranum sp.]
MKKLFLTCFVCFSFLAESAATAEDRVQLATLDSSSSPEVGAAPLWQDLDPGNLQVRSASVLVLDQSGHVIYAKQADQPRPIASITKLMTAMVILDSSLSLEEPVTITREDRDLLKLTGSRLKYGATLSREQLVRLALMASENRAAHALARTYPGGETAFVDAMNEKARSLGMHQSHFADPAGLNPGNVASARDVATMVRAARAYALILDATTTRFTSVSPYDGRGELRFGNTNRLLRNESWEIQLSKTGYISEAGRCLAMQAAIGDQSLVIVLLNSFGKLTPYGDSNRIRRWIEHARQS